MVIASGLFVLAVSPLSFAAGAAPGKLLELKQSALDPAVGTPADATDAAQSTDPAIIEALPAEPSAVVTPPPAAALPPLMDLTRAPTSVWQRIRNGFGLPDLASPLVREQEEWFSRRPEYIARTVARSSRYLYYIVDQVEKRGMPSEIALLPIIESAYNPVAYSRAHASGIWQFIPSTGKSYGLHQNFWYDGRRDVMAATNAALDYLQKLYEMFGSWDLALASYNWGEGAVSRAISKNAAKGLATDYQSLSMPNETRNYMPKLQAVKNIIANPAQFGIELAEVANQPYFVAVTTTKHIDVKLAAKFADMPVEEFVSLNPGNSRPVIRADGERTLLFPADKADIFRLNMRSNDQPLVSWQAYKLKHGETVDRIATRYGMSGAQLKHVNGITGKRGAAAGSTLLVPASGSATPYLPDLPSPTMADDKAPGKSAKYAARKGGAAKIARTKIAHTKVGHTKVAHNKGRKPTLAGKPVHARQAHAGKGSKKIVLAQKPH
ncbi:MAG: transglycosylase SLT domain-containing protein [Burkholderiales bacterium]